MIKSCPLKLCTLHMKIGVMSQREALFKELWENCMIRSFFEAVRETVGSVMNQHSGRNRHLQPLYFSIEMYLRWNLGPLHFLKNLIEDVYSRENKVYIRKTTKTDKIVTKGFEKKVLQLLLSTRNLKKNPIY